MPDGTKLFFPESEAAHGDRYVRNIKIISTDCPCCNIVYLSDCLIGVKGQKDYCI